MRKGTVGLLALFCLWAAQCRADIPAEVIRQGKKATAFVYTSRAEGSAFCIDANGLFVTNAHVLEGAAVHSRVMLALNPGESNQRVLEAEVVREDKQADLALLQTKETTGLTELELGSVGALSETQSVVAFGYPFGSELAVAGGKYPAISVNVGRITALRHKGGSLHELQLEASLNPGNSGGPVLNTKGQVVGVVQAGVPGTRIEFAIAVNRLRDFLRSVQVVPRFPQLTTRTQQSPQTFAVDVLTPVRPASTLAVTLALTMPGQETREFTLKHLSGNRFSVQAVPLPLNVQTVHLLVKDASGSGDYIVKNKSVSVGGQACKLSDIKQVVYGSSAYAVMTDGQKRTGIIYGLTGLETIEGGGVRLDITGAREIQIQPQTLAGEELKYRIVVRADGQTVCEASGGLKIQAAPLAPLAPAADVVTGPGHPAGAGEPGSISFAPSRVYPVPAALDVVTAADLDGDKWPDVVVGGGQELGVLYNHRNGTLEPYTRLLTWQAGVMNRAIADVNGDGLPDIIFTDGAERLVILINQGNRHFAEPTFQQIGRISTLTVADVNGDGNLDIIAVGGDGGGLSRVVQILLNDGSGVFHEKSRFTRFDYAEGAAVGDLNGDGKVDLAVTFETSTVDRSGVQIYYGDGTGNFQPGPTYYIGTQNMFGPTLTDFNGDGKLDLALCNYWSGTIVVMFGNGDGTFKPYTRYPAASYPLHTAVADFNGDGWPDIAVPINGNGSVYVYRNRGGGIFVDPLVVPSGGKDTRSCCVADFNRDGKPDLVVQNMETKTIGVLINTSPDAVSR